jgi:hypothetical protein
MSIIHFVILALATWRISSLLVDEPGPKNLFMRLRSKCGVKYNDLNLRYAESIIGEYLNCVWCASYIIGAILVVVYLLFPTSIYVFAVFAFSAVSMLADKQLWRGNRKEGR